MLGRRLRIVALAAIALFVVASFVDVDEPWFAIWVALLGADIRPDKLLARENSCCNR